MPEHYISGIAKGTVGLLADEVTHLPAVSAGDLLMIFATSVPGDALTLDDGSWTQLWQDSLTGGESPPMYYGEGVNACWWKIATANSGSTAGPDILPHGETDPDPPYSGRFSIVYRFRRFDSDTDLRVPFDYTPVVLGGVDFYSDGTHYSPDSPTRTYDPPYIDTGVVSNNFFGVCLADIGDVGRLQPAEDSDVPANMVRLPADPSTGISLTPVWEGATCKVFGTEDIYSGGPTDQSDYDPDTVELGKQAQAHSHDGNFTFFENLPPTQVRTFAVIAEPAPDVSLHWWGMLVSPM